MKNSYTVVAIALGVLAVGFMGWYIGVNTAEAPENLVLETPAENTASEETATSSAPLEAPAVTAPTAAPVSAPKVPTTPKPVVAAPAKPATSLHLVTYNGKGFSPRELTIIKGDTVRFLNISDESMWIVSDLPHTHNAYPIKTENGCSPTIFDMCTAIKNGKHWDFTFEREGTWGYHNESKSVMNGKIEVNLKGEKPATTGTY